MNTYCKTLILIVTLLAACSQKKISETKSLTFPEEKRIANLVQLTSSGTNAEAYWSYDSKWLTYQHKGPTPVYSKNEEMTVEKRFLATNPKKFECDQIFRIKADGSKINSVSNGEGRTTCSYFTPDDSRILFSSTHASGPACPPKPDMSNGYVWPVYNIYQFYSAKPDGSDIRSMEKNIKPSYNAEMVTCHNGSVVFTSNRDGDLEIYSAKLTGDHTIENIKRLTHEVGYDGGPVFSPDCTKITWRAHRPKNSKEVQDYQDLLKKQLVKPGKLEIWVANFDGTEAKQVTDLNAASFAPAFTPDGNHIVFASNVNDPKGRMQDLFYVSITGANLEQITFSHSFDAFPMFSPDGKKLAFSSNRFAKGHGQTNVFIADWVPFPDKNISSKSPTAIDRFQSNVEHLSKPEMEGRAAGTQGLKLAENYVGERFKQTGLKTLNQVWPKFLELKNSYFQSIAIQTGINKDPNLNTLKVGDTVKSSDFIPAPFSNNGEFSGEVVDVGYGLVAPEISVDDYSKKDVRGKIVLIRRHVPLELKLSVAQERNYSNPRFKAYLAREKGAVGVLFWEADKTIPEDLQNTFNAMSKSGTQSEAGIFAAFIKRDLAFELLHQPKTKVSGKINLNKTLVEAHNIIGVGGTTCKNDKPVVIGAHLDHLGHGAANSLEPNKNGIHHGADDNASGIAGLLETAHILSAKKGCYIFAAFTGEEVGIVGSSHLVQIFKKYNISVKAMLNMDMIGRMSNNTVIAFGIETAKEWKTITNSICDSLALKCVGSGDGYGPSDHMPFFIANIPVLHFFTGSHSDYHRVSDTSEKINSVGGAKVASLVTETAFKAASATIQFQKSKNTTPSMGRLALDRGDQRSYGAYLGTIPDYAENSNVVPAHQKVGVKLAGAKPGSPADKAGILKGDLLTEIVLNEEQKSHKIQNLEDFMYVLTSLKPDQSITISVNREGKKVSLPATVGRRSH